MNLILGLIRVFFLNNVQFRIKIDSFFAFVLGGPVKKKMCSQKLTQQHFLVQLVLQILNSIQNLLLLLLVQCFILVFLGNKRALCRNWGVEGEWTNDHFVVVPVRHTGIAYHQKHDCSRSSRWPSTQLELTIGNAFRPEMGAFLKTALLLQYGQKKYQKRQYSWRNQALKPCHF